MCYAIIWADFTFPHRSHLQQVTDPHSRPKDTGKQMDEDDLEHLDAPVPTAMDLPIAPERITALPKPDHLPWCARLKHLHPRRRIQEASEHLGLRPHQLTYANALINANPGIYTESGAIRMLPCSSFYQVLTTLRTQLSSGPPPSSETSSAMDIDEDDEQQYVFIESATYTSRELHDWATEQALRKLLAAMVEIVSTAPLVLGATTDRLNRPLLKTSFLRLLGPKPAPKPRTHSDIVLPEVKISFVSVVAYNGPKEQLVVEDVDMCHVTRLVKQHLLGSWNYAFQFSWKHPELGRMTVLDSEEFVQAMRGMHGAMQEDGKGGKDFVFQVEMMAR